MKLSPTSMYHFSNFDVCCLFSLNIRRRHGMTNILCYILFCHLSIKMYCSEDIPSSLLPFINHFQVIVTIPALKEFKMIHSRLSTQSLFSSRLTPLYTTIRNSHSHTSDSKAAVINVRDHLAKVATQCHCWNFRSTNIPKVGRNHFAFASLCLKALAWNFHEVVAQNLLKFNSKRYTCYGYKVCSDWEQEHRRFKKKKAEDLYVCSFVSLNPVRSSLS